MNLSRHSFSIKFRHFYIINCKCKTEKYAIEFHRICSKFFVLFSYMHINTLIIFGKLIIITCKAKNTQNKALECNNYFNFVVVIF